MSNIIIPILIESVDDPVHTSTSSTSTGILDDDTEDQEIILRTTNEPDEDIETIDDRRTLGKDLNKTFSLHYSGELDESNKSNETYLAFLYIIWSYGMTNDVMEEWMLIGCL